MAVTNEKFVNLAGNICPKCEVVGWENFRTLDGLKFIDSTTVVYPVECMACKHKFNQVFELAGHGPH